MSFLSFLGAYFIFFHNLVFPNFYKTTCTNIDLPANFLEITCSGQNVADFLRRNSYFQIVLNLVTNSVYP